MPKLRMNQAIARAIADEMQDDPRVIVFGEDVADAGGVFKTSDGLLEQFGPMRVRDTPISEMGFLGAAVGAAVTGLRPVAEIMFVEFLGVALDMVTTEAAKMHYLSGGALRAPLVVRASIGAGAGFGCQHSQTLEGWFTGVPGLTLCVASGPRAAYGLMRAAIRDDGPVVVLEPRTLYGEREVVDPGEAAIIELGTAEVVEHGENITIVGLGQTVGRAREATAAAEGWTADVIDLRTLRPWDRETVVSSVSRTGRLAVVEENPLPGGWGADIAAHVATACFGSLRAPVLRIGAPDVPVPFGTELERRYIPSADYIVEQVTHLVTTGASPLPWWEQEVSA